MSKTRKTSRKTRAATPRKRRTLSGGMAVSSEEAGAAGSSAAYASPPCFMHEADPSYMGYMGTSAVLALLNEMLEGERAGAKVAGALRKHATNPRVAALLIDIWIDEARFCAMLRRHIDRLGGTPSQKTGAFQEKVLALEGMDERLALLNKGQGWVVRKLREVLPQIDDDSLRTDLKNMLDVHEENIGRCAGVLPQRGARHRLA